MPETEPTPWELMRLLRSVDRKLDDVVTKDMFQAESKRVDEKFGEMGKDISDERAAREKAIADERVARERAMSAEKLQREQELGFERQARKEMLAEQKARADKLANNLKWVASAILIPITLFVIERFGGGL